MNSDINTNVRLFDLVRFMRSELHEAELITDQEYGWLCAEAPMAKGQGSPSPRRLEGYDEIRAKMKRMEAALSEVIKAAPAGGPLWHGSAQIEAARRALDSENRIKMSDCAPSKPSELARSVAGRSSSPSHCSALPAKVMQTKFGVDGDCFNACLASLLGVPLESVDYFRDEKTWYADLQEWLKPRGLAYVEIMAKPWNFYRFPLPVLAIAGGPSPRGVEGGHAVVVELNRYDRNIVHDPHPSGEGVLEIETIGLLTWQPSAPNATLSHEEGGKEQL